jgi:hypothetical protein
MTREDVMNLFREKFIEKEQANHLQEYEHISPRFHLEVDPFTTENGLLNQSMKLKRFEAEKHF